MISVNHTGSKHPKAENILLDSGPQINLISRSELLHSIVYESKQAHSFNGAPVQTIGHGIFTMKLADINIDLPTLLLPTGEQLSFPLIVSGEYLRDKLHMSIFEHYQVPCYLHDADTKLPRINLNKINGYLTIPINSKTLVNTVSLTTSTSCNSLHTICSHFNKRKIQKLLTNSALSRFVSTPHTYFNDNVQGFERPNPINKLF